MKSPRLLLPLAILAVLWLSFASYVWFTTPQLPERLATHFALGGKPDGWMSRESHLRLMLIMGTAVPALILGLFALIRRFNGWGLNIPNKDHWLAPERREETLNYVQRQGFWTAGLLLAFFAGIHHSILAANASSPVVLPMSNFAWVVGIFAALNIIGTVIFTRHFRKPA
ncbi:MAG TPA: DUF1648 domain-containing protein [Chthoniobacteraceae bacterium]|jgi:uncharacterized membrane protein